MIAFSQNGSISTTDLKGQTETLTDGKNNGLGRPGTCRTTRGLGRKRCRVDRPRRSLTARGSRGRAGASSPRPSTSSGACSASNRRTSSRAPRRARAELHRELLEVETGGIDVRGVPEPELDVHGRRQADHLGHLVEAHEPALVVGHLDVDVERCRAAERSSPSSASDRSVETLIVVAPSSCSARAVAPLAQGSRTDVLSTSVGGGRRPRRMSPSVASAPRSPTRNERIPCAIPRRPRRRTASTPACPGADPHARRWRATGRLCPTPRAGRGRARPRRRSRLPRRHLVDLSSVSIITPDPCETRRTGTPRRRPRPGRRASPPGPRPTGSRCGSGGRRRSGGRSCATYAQKASKRRDRSEARAPPGRGRPRSGRGAPGRARGGARSRSPSPGTARQRGHRSPGRRSARSCRCRLSPSAGFRGSGRWPRARERAGHDPVTRNGPGGILGEDVSQREPLFPRKRVEDPADDRLVLSAATARPPSGRSGRRHVGAGPR